ncbi:cytochrome P450 [Desarmillaria tabescens]|uniref:Cytochrome P450 n=1 Tax=Armillaria tabescens TaxID=1929756 RepID=A0AA39JW74_ARMTA|nr:cytochrome P450 [Desarmillaria tabescens]KAK0448935.1 cytochrome P450 [Desarmillaria tabescens]
MSLNEYVSLVRQVDNALVLVQSLGIATVLLLAIQFRKTSITRAKLKAIPTVGSSGIIASWINAFSFIFHAKEIIQEGQRMHCGSAFKVTLPDRWVVIVSGPEKIDDIRKSPVEQLSSMDANADIVQMNYTIGRSVVTDPYHIDVIRGAFTRNIAACFADVQDEIKAAFNDNIPMTENWIEIPAYQTALQIICRASNRMFVGLPLCRNHDYIKLNINHTINAFTCAYIMNLLPTFLKPIVGFIFTPCRLAEGIYGKNWQGKPNDAIHTTAMAFTNALYALAAHLEYVETLRTEVESMIKEEGNTKAAMDRMNQLDSFLKESQRLYGDFGVFGMRRVVRKDFVFSDGTVVPAGTQVAVVSWCTHLDEKNYENPLEFKPWRFSERRKQGGEGMRHQLSTPNLDFISFGMEDRHGTPGRFFAANELKALMSYILMNFDVKIDKVPPSMWFSSEQSPNQSSKVSFRKRTYTTND